jgi:hypothetical protein
MKRLFKTKLEVFILKRMLITFFLLTVVDFLFVKNWALALIGLTTGGIFRILKFSSYVFVFGSAVSANGRSSQVVLKSILVFVISQLVVLPLMYAALKINIWLFIGVVTGILLVPFVLFINSITEVLKITHNNFE